jgi:16S rRNA (guanine(1405)-N(7))-methyltransferase
MDPSQDPLEALVVAVRATSKYGHLSVEVVRSVGARELAVRGNLKDAIKATKSKLHQVGAAYMPQPMHYARWLEELHQARDENRLEEACLRIMRAHASTAERLPILAPFYATVLRQVAPVKSVLDLACGLNPLAIPWMPLAEGARYTAYDIYADLADFLSHFLAIVGVAGEAGARDVLHLEATEPVQVALLLKALPCLEQMDKVATRRLLEQAPAEHILVSYPVHSLGGRAKGMVAHYDAQLSALLAGKPWRTQRFEFATELAYLISRT